MRILAEYRDMELTTREYEELEREISLGHGVYDSDQKEGIDYFVVDLSTGKSVAGAYDWESESGEYIYLRVE